MHLDEVHELLEYWKEYPPLRDLVAAFIGFKPAEKAEPQKYLSAADMRRIMQMTGGKIARTSPLPGKP